MKCAALSALLVFGCTLYGAEKQERDTENAMLAAYSNLQYSEEASSFSSSAATRWSAIF